MLRTLRPVASPVSRSHAWRVGVLGAALAVAGASCAKPTVPVRDGILVSPSKGDLEARAAAAQDRIAKAFHASIVPNLKACWGQLAGQGGVRFHYTYQRREGRWRLGQVEGHATSLAPTQTELALRCMRQATRGSDFPFEPDEAAQGADELELFWGWPVPLPEDTTELARMITHAQEPGCPKLCKDCNLSSQCESTCSGWYGCSPTPNGCQMDGKQSCKTGWSGSLRGVLMQ